MHTYPAVFRHKPTTVEAMPFTQATLPQVNEWLASWVGEGKFYLLTSGDTVTLHIETLEGDRDCPAGYWLVRGTHGEPYVIRPDIFADVYEPLLPLLGAGFTAGGAS